MFLELLLTTSGGPLFLVCQSLISVEHCGETGERFVKYEKP